MTVSNSTNKIIGNGNGATTSWPFSFKVFDPEHLVVTYTDAGGDESTLDPGDYTVSLNADQDASPGGTLGYSPAIASGTKLTILRSVPYTQATDLKNQGGFFPEVLERGFDLVVMQVQQLREQLARALKLSPSQSAIGELEATDAARAGSYLGFDLAGNLSLYAGVAAQSVSTAMQPVVSAASLALARAALGLGSLATLTKATNADLANMAQGTLKGRLTAGAGAPEDLTAGQASAILNALIQPGGRLTLTSALAVTVADVTAAAALYYTHHTHDLAPLWDGTHWRNRNFGELSLALDGDSGHAGYHQGGRNFDVFLFDHDGTLRIGTPAAWSSDTTRASAYLSRQNGRWVNNATLALRYGSGALDLVDKAAGLALYIGTFRTTASAQTEDSAAKRFVWNTYNRAPRFMRVLEAANAWNYSAAAWRQANGNAANQIAFVRGMDEDRVSCWVYASALHDSTPLGVSAAIGLDSTSTPAAGSARVTTSISNYLQNSLNPRYLGYPSIGYHYLTWLEYSSNTPTTTWIGNGGGTLVQTGIFGEAWA